MDWKKPSDIPMPQPGDYPNMAEFMLAYDVWSMIQGGSTSFERFASVQAFVSEIVQYAFSLTQNVFQQKLAPTGWNWSLAGISTAMKCLGYLDQIAMNLGDSNTVSILKAFQTGKLTLFGGHDPIGQPPASSGTNPSTGQSVVVGPSIF